MSNGERGDSIVRNGSLWGNVVFKKEVIFHQFDFETSELEFEAMKSRFWKHTTLCDKSVFFYKLSRNFNHQLSSNFHGFVILCTCWDTPSEKTGLWQLPIVSSVFKSLLKPTHCGYVGQPLYLINFAILFFQGPNIIPDKVFVDYR